MGPVLYSGTNYMQQDQYYKVGQIICSGTSIIKWDKLYAVGPVRHSGTKYYTGGYNGTDCTL